MRIGIIGTGAMGLNHMRVVSSLPDFTLTAAMDTDAQRLAAACSGRTVTALADYRQMPDLVDAVIVAVPTTQHHEVARFFLAAGKHVLVEKPFTTTLAEADDLIALAAEQRLVLAVGHLERFNPAVQYVMPHVVAPRYIDVERLGSFSPRSLDVDVIMDLMIHDLDIILQWDSSGIAEIRAVGIPILSRKVDIANVRVQFHSGMVANITASRVSQEKIRKIRIFQPGGYISIDYQQRSVKWMTLDGQQIGQHTPVIEPVEPLVAMWRQFYLSVQEGRPGNVTGPAARAALAVALEISAAIAHSLGH
jgi:predicted dehydrogenase